MNTKKFLIIIVIIIFSISAKSQELNELPISNTLELIERINQFSRKTTSITADFTQEKEMSFMEEKIISAGKFYFQKENKLRWEYTEPFAYAIILNGDRIRVVDEGKIKDFDAGQSRMFLEISNVMTGMVNGSLLTGNQFAVSWFEAPDYYRAELVPNGEMMKDYLARIELKLNKNDFSVDGLKMFEKSGDFTLVIFRNKKLNETIPAEIFSLD